MRGPPRSGRGGLTAEGGAWDGRLTTSFASTTMHRPLSLALLAAGLAVLPACQTTQDVTDAAAEGVEDAADATATVARGAADAAEDAGQAVAGVASDAYDEARDALGDARVAADARVAVARVSAPADTTTGVTGTVTFVELADGVRVRYDVAGLAPNSVHGLHLHENGTCAAADADGDGYAEAGGAAGAHLNPGNDPHGAPDDPMSEKHAGDLGNIEADAGGAARGTVTVESLAFAGDRTVLGRAVIVHADADEFADAGAMSGGRVGCGVVAETDRR